MNEENIYHCKSENLSDGQFGCLYINNKSMFTSNLVEKCWRIIEGTNF